MNVFETAGFTPHVVPCDDLPILQAGMMRVVTGEAVAIGLRGDWSHLYVQSNDVVAIPLDEPNAFYDVQMVWRTDEDRPVVMRFLAAMTILFPTPGTAP